MNPAEVTLESRENWHPKGVSFFCPVSRQASLQEEVGVKKLRAAQQRLFFLDLDYGAQRKTRGEVKGNSARTALIPKQPPAFTFWAFS